MDDLYTIDTPENIEFDYDIAGIGSRFLAAIIDTLLIGLSEIIVFFVAGVIAGQLSLSQIGASGSVLTALASLLSFAILWGYYMIFELVWNGQSPGKRAIGLRVVREGGRPITPISAAIRNLIRIVDFLPLFYGIGVVVMFVDRRARRVGDLAAGTLVVKERRAVTLESLTRESVAPLGWREQAGRPRLPNIALLNDQDYHLVQEFLRRYDELSPAARVRIGGQLASGLQGRLGLPQGADPEAFLRSVAVQYQLLKRQQAPGA